LEGKENAQKNKKKEDYQIALQVLSKAVRVGGGGVNARWLQRKTVREAN